MLGNKEATYVYAAGSATADGSTASSSRNGTATDAYSICATEAGAGGYGTGPTGYGSYL